jgi:hypothetical protein
MELRRLFGFRFNSNLLLAAKFVCNFVILQYFSYRIYKKLI